MFLKIVVVLLLLIVAASLLAPRRDASGRRQRPALRPLFLRLAIALLVIAALAAWLHTLALSGP